MNALLSPEQEAVREVATDIADDLATTHPNDLESELSARRWQRLTGSGLIGLRVADAEGLSASGVEVAVVAEQLGRALVRESYLGAVFAVELAQQSGADEFARSLASGDRRATVALTPDLGDLAAPGCPGAVAWDAAGCDQVLMLDGRNVVALDLGADRVDSVDLTRELRRVDPASAPRPVGTLSDDAEVRWLALALTGLAADLVGVMDAALARAVRYAREREQFGAPIGSFQGIAHLCADQAVSVTAARSAVNYSAWCVDERPPQEALRAARTAKAFASEAGRTVCEAGIQVHGGLGITWECMAHLYLRRALMSRQALGDELYQLNQLAEQRGAA